MKPWSSTAWGRRAAIRAFSFAALGWLLCFAVTALSDEGNVGWLERTVRALAASPIAAALGCAATMRAAEARGECRALEALGCTPWEQTRPALLGAAAWSAVAAVVMATRAPLDAFFPRAEMPVDYQYDTGTFTFPDRAVRVRGDGTLEALAPARLAAAAAAPARFPPHARVSATLTLALAGCAMPLAAARALRQRHAAPLFGAAGAGALTIVAFHGAAAGHLEPLVSVAPSALLLAREAWHYRASSWERNDRRP